MKEKAKEFVDNCRAKGWCVEIPRKDQIITIYKLIEKNSMEDFVKADTEYFSLITKAPTVSLGSIWGTDGGGVGGLAAIASGCFVMNRSGVSKRFIKAVRKYLIDTPDLNIEL